MMYALYFTLTLTLRRCCSTQNLSFTTSWLQQLPLLLKVRLRLTSLSIRRGDRPRLCLHLCRCPSVQMRCGIQYMYMHLDIPSSSLGGVRRPCVPLTFFVVLSSCITQKCSKTCFPDTSHQNRLRYPGNLLAFMQIAVCFCIIIRIQEVRA